MALRRAALFIAVLAVAFSAAADTFTLARATGNWSDTTLWFQNGSTAARYPGQLTGTNDVVQLSIASYSVTVNVGVAEAVTLQMTVGPGLLDIPAGGSLKLTAASSVASGATFQISGGMVTNAGTLNFDGSSLFNWSAGILDGAGTTNVTRLGTTGARLDIINAASKTLRNQTVNVNGDVTHSGGPLAVDDGAKININSNGTFNLIGDVTINSDGTNGAHIDNMSGASILKTAGAGTATLNVMLNNNGIVQSDSGGMKFTKSGTHTGTFKICDACIFEWSGGTHTLDGALILYINFAGNPIAKLTGATFDVATSAQISTNHQFIHTAGTISGAGTLAIFAAYQWSGGTQSGTGETQLASYIHTFDGATGPMIVNGRNMLINGTVNYSPVGANFLSIDSNAVVTNAGGTINLTTNAPINSDGTGTLQNENGTVNKSGGAGKAVIHAFFKNVSPIIAIGRTLVTHGRGGALLNIDSGQLALNGGGVNEGTILVPNAGNAVVFEGAPFDLNAGTSTNPADLGVFRIDGGTLNVNTPLTLTNVELLAGTLCGGSDLNISRKLKWTGGTIVGPGNTTIDATATLTHLAPTLPTYLDNRVLHNNGIVEYEGNGLELSNNAVINNNLAAQFRTRDGAILDGGGGTNVFNNFGTLRKTGGVGTARIDVPVTSGGTAGSDSSVLRFAGGGTITGPIDIGAGDAVEFAVGSFFSSAGASVTGTGLFRLVSGSFDVSAPLSIANLEIAGGVLTGSGALSLTNVIWIGGNLDGSGAATIGGGGTMTIATAPGQALTRSLGKALTNNGTTNLQVANLGGTGTFANNNTFTHNTASANTFAPAFTNGANVNLLAGSVAFNGGYTQNAGVTDLAGGTFSSPSPANFNGGLLKGAGAIGASIVNNGATVAPGASPGVTTINGNYSQSSSGVLNIEIGGTSVGTQYDRLAVNGSATFAGTINVTLINGFTLSNGDIFDVVTYASHSGLFNPENLPPVPSGTFSSAYTPTVYQLAALTAEVSVSKSGPAAAKTGAFIKYTIVVKNLSTSSSAANVIVTDPTPAGLVFQNNTGDCTTPFPCALGTLPPNATRTIIAAYLVTATSGTVTNTATINVVDGNAGNNTSSAVTSISCPNFTPTNLQPSGTGATDGTLSWTDNGAEQFQVFFGPKGSGCTTPFGVTTGNSMTYAGLLADTEYEWKVVGSFDGCPVQSTACVTFKTATCPTPEAPLASVVGQATSTKTYTVSWAAITNAIRYEVDEANNPSFTNAVTTVVQGATSLTFSHQVTQNTSFWYRVRAFIACTTLPGPYSIVIRVVIVPPPSPADKNPTVTIPVGTGDSIVQKVFIPGTPGLTQFFTAKADREWLFVTPPNGVLPPEGVTLDVIIDPSRLPNGTFIATIIVTTDTAPSGAVRTHGTTVSIPISVNLVTPVTPVSAKGPTQHSLIIPAVGHLSGLNSEWQSDVRVTNAGFRAYKYRLTFTPAAGNATGVKQTDITVDAGATTALDDIVKNWYGFGSLNDGQSGVLEIVPIDDPANASLVTVASSRTYNVTQNGTLGQFVPAVPFPNFIGKAAAGALGQILSLQQLAQTSAVRTNVGITEAGGKSANAIISIFNSAGIKLADLPQPVSAGQQLQLNALLQQNGIQLEDGRIEIRVTDGDGKITGYASVVNNGTGDPFLVSGVSLGQAGATKFVLPGAANLNTGFADWRTDMRIFNYGTIPHNATLTFFPLGGGTPRTATVEAKVGEVLSLNNIVKTLFGGDNIGGAVHVTTSQPASFIVSGRTYNQTAAGEFGQFIPAVTLEQTIARGGKTLHILQVEDSVRFRTNVTVGEITGQPAVVELKVVLPDSKITPTVQIPLAANEFRQFNIIRDLALGNVYNARVAVRVVDGEGRVTAAGSLIDELTGDPSLIPGQQ